MTTFKKILLIVFLLTFINSFFVFNYFGGKNKDQQEENITFKNIVIAPLGEINPDSNNNFVIKTEESIGIAGEYKSNFSGEVSIDLLDKNQEVLKENFLPKFSIKKSDQSSNKNSEPNESLITNNFSVCCANSPSEPGSYSLEFNANNEKVDVTSFKVVN